MVNLCYFNDVLQIVGCIGLGNMGSKMAHNVFKATDKIAVHDM